MLEGPAHATRTAIHVTRRLAGCKVEVKDTQFSGFKRWDVVERVGIITSCAVSEAYV